MHKKSLAVAFVLFLASASSLFAQALSCPRLELASPDTATTGESVTVTVSLSGGDPNVSATYNWSVSDGSIESGQGTSTIVIDTKEAASEFVTATVDIGGYERECSTTESTTVSLTAKEEPEPEPSKPPAR
jgi:hypothetical protein